MANYFTTKFFALEKIDHLLIEKLHVMWFLFTFLFISACNSSEEKNEQEYHIPEGMQSVYVHPEEKELVYKLAQVKPHPRQVEWQQLEFTAFIHFTVNTFTNKEWGDGTESPAIFNPTALNAEQWVRVCKEAGMRMIILTCKHHDGFALWPSNYTRHSVEYSPWRNGKGDLVKEVSQACQKYGLKFGVYLSPWDRHEPTYGTEDYNQFFVNQLTELLTQYGEVSEVWFDGANGEGPNGKKQEYNWGLYYSTVREQAPGAVIAVVGPDVRWVGNEAGKARNSEWSVIPTVAEGAENGEFDPAFRRMLVNGQDEDLGSRELLQTIGADNFIWFPAEVNTSIRPGWFYHSSEDNQVKSVEKLEEIYYKSVGGNAVFLLNIPPDKRGLIHENDVAVLQALGKKLRESFANDLTANATISASNTKENSSKFQPSNILDDNPGTYWTTDDWVEKATIELELPERMSFNRAVIQEYIPEGQRIEYLILQAWDGQNWKNISEITTIGHKRILKFETVSYQKVRINILASRFAPTLSSFGLFYVADEDTALSNERDSTDSEPDRNAD